MRIIYDRAFARFFVLCFVVFTLFGHFLKAFSALLCTCVFFCVKIRLKIRRKLDKVAFHG